VDVPPHELELDHLVIPVDLEDRIKAHLEPRRVLTVRVVIRTPVYQGVKVVARVRAAAGLRPETVREVAERALYEFINPLTGGPSGQGWPYDHDLTMGDVYAVLAGLPGLSSVLEVHFFTVDLRSPSDAQRVDQRIPLTSGALFLSYQHRVVVDQ
jgi:hypothetical protein